MSTKGKTIYATCASCHGPKAEGNESMNAPALKAIAEVVPSYAIREF